MKRCLRSTLTNPAFKLVYAQELLALTAVDSWHVWVFCFKYLCWKTKSRDLFSWFHFHFSGIAAFGWGKQQGIFLCVKSSLHCLYVLNLKNCDSVFHGLRLANARSVVTWAGSCTSCLSKAVKIWFKDQRCNSHTSPSCSLQPQLLRQQRAL